MKFFISTIITPQGGVIEPPLEEDTGRGKIMILTPGRKKEKAPPGRNDGWDEPRRGEAHPHSFRKTSRRRVYPATTKTMRRKWGFSTKGISHLKNPQGGWGARAACAVSFPPFLCLSHKRKWGFLIIIDLLGILQTPKREE